MCSRLLVSALALVVLCSCGSELKLGQTFGMSPIRGDTRLTLHTPPGCDTQDCRVTFSRTVVIATKKDYAQFNGLLKAVDLDVRTLTLIDEGRNVELTPLERIRSGAVIIASELALGREELATLPRTLRLEGASLDEVRAQIARGDPAMLPVRAELVITPPLPEKLLIRYDVQPVLVIGAQ